MKAVNEMELDNADRVWLSALKLTDFRNYEFLSLDFSDRHIVLIGNNGAGKTNILEAVSFLSPGRGLRRAAYDDVARENGNGTWIISAALENASGTNQIGSGFISNSSSSEEKQRQVRINGTNARSAEQLAELVRIIWLTPAMDRLFAGPASDRRKFLDRLVLAIDPQHGRRVALFEKAMRSRNRLLAERPNDSEWIDGLEIQIAEYGVAISCARKELVSCLSNLAESQKPADSAFPSVRLSLDGEFENTFNDIPATDAEDIYKRSLKVFRPRDAAAGRMLNGPHLTDLGVRHFEKNTEAAQSSTGEQKSLLIGIILAHAKLVSSLSGAPPILLLDEVAAHLDAMRRGCLFDQLDELGGQCWMTGTDGAFFNELGQRAQMFKVDDGQVESAP